MTTIVDYGMGNIGSIQNMFRRIGHKTIISSDPDRILKADRIILPGVGAFDNAMNKISENNIREVLNEKALQQKIPILGICLGMQLLTESSDEGLLPGLGWINGKTLSFKKNISDMNYKIPHMGWNQTELNGESLLTKGFDNEFKFYFVHSYFVKCENPKHAILQTQYGIKFDSALQKDNIFGVQFHPEKSHKYGMKLLENFSKI